MKNLVRLVSILAFYFAGLSSAFALNLSKLEDEMVPASLIEDFAAVSAKDKKVTAQILTVYRGGAAGMSGVVVSFFDQSESSGDYPNSVSYELNYVTSKPTKIVLSKAAPAEYVLSFQVTEVVMTQDGEFKYPVRKVALKISLDERGAVREVRL